MPTSVTTVPFVFVERGGQRRPDSCAIEGDYSTQLKEIAAAGLVFTAEVVNTGHVVLCLENREYGDFMNRVAVNGPGPKCPPSVARQMLADWDKATYEKWLVGVRTS